MAAAPPIGAKISSSSIRDAQNQVLAGAAQAGQQQHHQDEGDVEDLFPPENFAMVDTGIYRSSFPMKKHFPFLRRLGLKTILTLVMEEYPPANMEFLAAENVRLMQIGVDGNKEPFKYIPHVDVVRAVNCIRDRANHPLLIHCNKGKHRTGCLVGCYRKTQQWGLSSIFDEYIRFAAPKSRMVDQRYIELFQDEPNLQGLPGIAPDGPEETAPVVSSSAQPPAPSARARGPPTGDPHCDTPAAV